MKKMTDRAARGPKAAARPTAFSLDRLGAALARRRAPYGRGELLEVLSEAFGHRNSNETRAAVEAGALSPAAIAPLGVTTAPDGTPLACGRDPEGRLVAFDAALASRERYVASPHGGIADLTALSAIGGPDAAALRGAATWHVAEITSGSRVIEVVAASTPDDLLEKVATLLADGLLDDASAPEGEWDAGAIVAAYRAQGDGRDDVAFYGPAAHDRLPPAARAPAAAPGRGSPAGRGAARRADALAGGVAVDAVVGGERTAVDGNLPDDPRRGSDAGGADAREADERSDGVAGPRVTAECHTDDFVAVARGFDVTSWFEEASDDEVAALAAIGWGGDRESDEVAERFEGGPGYDGLTAVLARARSGERMASGDRVGFECRVDGDEAMAWLLSERPALHARILATEG